MTPVRPRVLRRSGLRRTAFACAVVAASCAAVLAACGDGKKNIPATTSTLPGATATRPATGEPFLGGQSLVEAAPQASTPPELVNVTAEQHPGYDRITFEFAGDGVPGFRVEYYPPPTECPGGPTAVIAGTLFLQVTFTALTHDALGTPSASVAELTPNLLSLQQAKQTCTAEPEITWGLGLSAALDFHVTPLNDPPRVQLDIAHP